MNDRYDPPAAGAGAGAGAHRTERPPSDRSTGASVDWAVLHRTTRTSPTVTTFGWRTEVAFSAPPLLVLGWWTATGAFFNGVVALGLGVPMLAAAVWWLRQVWVAGPAASAGRRSAGPAPTLSTAEAVARPMHPSMAYLYEPEADADEGRAPRSG